MDQQFILGDPDHPRGSEGDNLTDDQSTPGGEDGNSQGFDIHTDGNSESYDAATLGQHRAKIELQVLQFSFRETRLLFTLYTTMPLFHFCFMCSVLLHITDIVIVVHQY